MAGRVHIYMLGLTWLYYLVVRIDNQNEHTRINKHPSCQSCDRVQSISATFYRDLGLTDTLHDLTRPFGAAGPTWPRYLERARPGQAGSHSTHSLCLERQKNG